MTLTSSSSFGAAGPGSEHSTAAAARLDHVALGPGQVAKAAGVGDQYIVAACTSQRCWPMHWKPIDVPILPGPAAYISQCRERKEAGSAQLPTGSPNDAKLTALITLPGMEQLRVKPSPVPASLPGTARVSLAVPQVTSGAITAQLIEASPRTVCTEAAPERSRSDGAGRNRISDQPMLALLCAIPAIRS